MLLRSLRKAYSFTKGWLITVCLDMMPLGDMLHIHDLQSGSNINVGLWGRKSIWKTTGGMAMLQFINMADYFTQKTA